MKLEIKIDDQDLPMISAVAMEALDLLKDAKVTHQRLGDLICRDPSLAARVLRTANSSYYGGRTPAGSISDAIFRLGMNNLRNIIVMAATGEFFSNDDPGVQLLWQHSIDTAMAASFLANALESTDTEAVFIAGLLHDVGKLIILRQYPDIYGPMISDSVAMSRPLHGIEEETFNYFNHMSVGGMVIRRWNLHESITEAARFHHDVTREIPLVINHEKVVCIVALANQLVNAARVAEGRVEWETVKDCAYVKVLSLNDKIFIDISSNILFNVSNQ